MPHLVGRHEVVVDLPQLLHAQVDVLLRAAQLLRELVDRQHLPLHAQEPPLEAQQRLLHLPHLRLVLQHRLADARHAVAERPVELHFRSLGVVTLGMPIGKNKTCISKWTVDSCRYEHSAGRATLG